MPRDQNPPAVPTLDPARPLNRALTLARFAIVPPADAAARDAFDLEFSGSSEEPAEQYYGTEVLSHDPGAVRLGRVAGGACPLLFNHDRDRAIGMVTGAQIVERRLQVTARLFDTADALEKRQMIAGGLRSISVRYRIHKIEHDTKTDIFTATDWEPLEFSLVTIPADPTVGVDRAAADLTPARPAQSTPKGNATMDNNVQAPAADGATPTTDGTQVERLRIRAINDLCRQHKIADTQRDEWVDAGITADVAATKILDVLAERGRNNAPNTPAHLDLSARDLKRFSVLRAVVAARDKDWSKAGFEAECSREIAGRLGVVPDATRFYVPLDVQARPIDPRHAGAQRDMTVASASGGGYLVATENQGFIDLLRNVSVAYAMGARRLPGLVGNVTVPKLTAGATAYWLATESSAPTESAQTLGQLALSPKTVSAYVEISRLLALQSSPGAEDMVMADLAKQSALAVDAAAIAGAGSGGEPQGIIGLSGVGTFTGTSLDYAALLNAQADVAAANALTPTCGYVFTPAVAALLMARVKYSNTASPLWDGNMLAANCAGFKGMSSNQVPSAKGIFGDWQQVVIGEWGILQVEVNPYANFAAGIIGVRAMYTVDVGVRYAGAFSTTSSIT